MSEKWKQRLDLVRSDHFSNTSFQDISLSLDEMIQLASDYIKEVNNLEEGVEWEKAVRLMNIDLKRAMKFGTGLFKLKQRTQLQQHLINRDFHKHLARIISLGRTDSKCRTLAAQLLCNIGTINAETSNILLADIKPSVDMGTSMNHLHELSWSDMIYISGVACDRDALAAIVASIYNCLCSLDASSDLKTNAKNIAEDVLLMCNLMRYILPSSVIRENVNGTIKDQSDSATDWILLLIEKLATVGFFRSMFLSLGPQTSYSRLKVTPEQIILLHCIAKEVDEYSRYLHTNDAKKLHPLAGSCTAEERKENFEFLVDKCLLLRPGRDLDLERESDMDLSYDGENQVMKEASALLLEMITNTLSTETSHVPSHCNDLRHCNGVERLLRDVILDLGNIVDRMGLENKGVNARQLKISDDDQMQITNAVRYVGNVCFQCTKNQDIVRETIVPIPYESYSNVQQYSHLPINDASCVRNGLHVLLSCTSFAYGCFTLREWSIVAIRNVLDGNETNQQIVAELEAKQALDTPELQRVGIKLELDKRGNVKVTPRDES
jgi:hypothetical protein